MIFYAPVDSVFVWAIPCTVLYSELELPSIVKSQARSVMCHNFHWTLQGLWASIKSPPWCTQIRTRPWVVGGAGYSRCFSIHQALNRVACQSSVYDTRCVVLKTLIPVSFTVFTSSKVATCENYESFYLDIFRIAPTRDILTCKWMDWKQTP